VIWIYRHGLNIRLAFASSRFQNRCEWGAICHELLLAQACSKSKNHCRCTFYELSPFCSFLREFFLPANRSRFFRILLGGRVGSGFSERALETLHDGFQKIRRTTCPFVNLPERTRGRWGLGITPAVMRNMQLGRAGIGHSNQIYRVDQRQSATPARLSRTADR